MANKAYATSLVIKEMKMKTAMRFYYTPMEIPKEKDEQCSMRKDAEELEHSYC